MSEPRKLSSYVEPNLSDSRVDAQWEGIQGRLPLQARTSGARRAALPAFALAAAAALTVVWLRPDTQQRSGWEGSVVRSDDAPVEMTLAEGSLVELSPRSKVELLHSDERSVQLKLSEGSARFSVKRERARSFTVESGPVEVRVSSTLFSVSRIRETGGERVRVDVEEGSVEVRRHDAEASSVRLVQGEHWSTFVAYEKSRAPLEEVMRIKQIEPSEQEADDEIAATENAAVDEDAAELDTGAAKSRRSRRAVANEGSSATDLFDRANIARRAGQLKDAASLYAEVVQRFPKDRSAALAAFELGRIRMDGLSDPRGAVQAFERALALDGRRAFAEDALARLALAHDALGETESCQRAKDRYLARYPEGVHSKILAKRCPGP